MVEKMTRRLLVVPGLLALLAGSPAAFAHQLDEYVQATLVFIDPTELRLDVVLTPGVAVASQVLELMDRDHDGIISRSEAAAYAETLRHDLTVQLDQREIHLKFVASEFPALEELRTGWGIIRIQFSARTGPLGQGVHKVAVTNRHLPKTSAYLFNAAFPKSTDVHITRQSRNSTQSTGEIEFVVDDHGGSLSSDGIVLAIAALPFALFMLTRRKARSSSRTANR